LAIIDIAQFEDTLVLHFETEGKRINAYTLASTLVAIADAAKAANTSLNPGCEIEIVVEAIGPGSFRAQIRALYKKHKTVLGVSQLVVGVVIGVLGNYIYERTLALDDSVKIEVNTDEVIIQHGNDRVIVPRNVYEATREAEKNPNFPRAVSRAFDAISQDKDISGIGLVPKLDSSPPGIIISRRELALAAMQPIDTPNNRIVPEQVDLQILKAILERGKRKWEFMWRGIKISAPVTDEQFYVDFFAHDITIAPGDILQVTLHVYQTKDTTTGIYKNTGYEVVQVHSHTPRVKQLNLLDTASND
jgi:hypothetical protein